MQEDIHEKLDQVLVEYNKILDQYQDLRSQLGDAMKNGFWNLSRARNALPAGSISEKRYPPSIEPLITIELGNSAHPTLTLKHNTPTTIPPTDSKDKNNTDTKGEDKKEKPKKPLDPSQWFAYLPSSSLKQSQTNFKTSINIIVQLANITVRLESLADEYSNLLEKSKQM
eukprot:TRINITY_DN8927_c0_g1_i1.p1 TRINITY_DN8927_c0_g1~~TRINITY_DN8927_c0_g1_i1.p1  ORF type:complete len:170 (+),score=23.36 TRINITY_DN8927_c0_g1_i1:42-551(+)